MSDQYPTDPSAPWADQAPGQGADPVDNGVDPAAETSELGAAATAPAAGQDPADPSAWSQPTQAPESGAPAGWPSSAGWQSPDGTQYPPAAAPYGTDPGAQQPWAGAPAGAEAPWPAQTAAYPPYSGGSYPGQADAWGHGGSSAYGYPGQAGPSAGAWQQDTTVIGAAGDGSVPPAQPTGAPEKAPRGKPRLGLLLAAAAVVGLLAGGVGGYLGAQVSDQSSTSASSVSLPQTGADKSPRPEGSIADIAARVSPAVVSIEVDGPGGAGTGSGSVIRSDGYILTNNHVVESAANGGSITAHFSDGRSLAATIVGRDTSYDLAVIKVDATDLPTVVLGNSDGVVVGDLAIAIGSPLGLDGTVTSGIVSALNRPVTAGDSSGGGETSFIDAIQTDAAINPGNSGGPLVNAAGEVIGVNSAIASLGSGYGQQGGSIGLGFAIPVNQAKRIADELISTGTSTKPVIGVRLDTQYTGDGARVATVTAGSPAADAGMQDGDVIVKFDGQTITDSTDLVVKIRAKQPGDKVTVTVQRGSSTEDLTVALGSDSSSN